MIKIRMRAKSRFQAHNQMVEMWIKIKAKNTTISAKMSKFTRITKIMTIRLETKLNIRLCQDKAGEVNVEHMSSKTTTSEVDRSSLNLSARYMKINFHRALPILGQKA